MENVISIRDRYVDIAYQMAILDPCKIYKNRRHNALLLAEMWEIPEDAAMEGFELAQQTRLINAGRESKDPE